MLWVDVLQVVLSSGIGSVKRHCLNTAATIPYSLPVEEGSLLQQLPNRLCCFCIETPFMLLLLLLSLLTTLHNLQET
jgi:hypothetical protein